MGLFKHNKDPEFRITEWQNLPENELKERITPVIAYVASCLEASQGLIVSPGSEQSKRFVNEIAEAVKKFAQCPPTASKIEASRQAFEESAKEFGVWQREQVSGLQREISESVRTLIGTCKQSMETQEGTIEFVNGLQTKLQIAEQTDDITVLRAIIREETFRAREVLACHEKSHKTLQDDFDKSIKALENKLGSVEGTGSKDYLTECASRAALDFYLSAICRKAQYERKLYSVAMIDLDDFKGINDIWGHQIGDRALNFFVQSIKQEFPTRAFIGRYGGDEFVVVATMSADELLDRLSKFIQRIRKTVVPIRESDHGKLTLSASVGITEVTEADESDRVLRRADQALYEAKKQGKGRVSLTKDDAA